MKRKSKKKKSEQKILYLVDHLERNKFNQIQGKKMLNFFVKIQPECVLFLYVLYKPKRLWQDICFNLIKHGAETIYIYIYNILKIKFWTK